jgi:putative phage-type endonuclease
MPPKKLPANLCGLTEEQIRKYQAQLRKLLKIPLVEQKTEAWYNMRHNMITASDFAQALGEGKFGTVADLILKKCQTQTGDNKAFSATNPFFRWGNLFEPVACDLYSKIHGGLRIHEFGLLQHYKHSFFGASPDGISELGVMVEIKCPLRRKIVVGGDVPKQYYYQIQGQLDVCKLDVCDYFECEFQRVDSDDLEDEEHAGRWRGVLIDMCERADTGEVGHKYGPICAPEEVAVRDKLTEFVKQELDASGGYGKPLYWSLAVYNLKRVYKEQEWVDEKLKELEEVWKKILYYRENPDKIEMEVSRSLTIDTECAFVGGCGVGGIEDENIVKSGFAIRKLEESDEDEVDCSVLKKSKSGGSTAGRFAIRKLE